MAIAILVFEHIQNLREAFGDVNKLLRTGGQFYLIVCDKDYSVSNDKELRSAGFVSTEIIKELEGDAVETKTVRDLTDGSSSVMYDIFRPVEQVREAAKTEGLTLITEQALLSSTATPVPMLHVLVFTK